MITWVHVKEESLQVCSTEFVYTALLNTGDEIIESIVMNVLRPLSDFPESERWQPIEDIERFGYIGISAFFITF